MRKFLVSLTAFIVLAGGGVAVADLSVLDGAGATKVIKNFVCETTKLCNATVLIKSDGTEIGTSSAEVFVGGRGTAGSAAGGVLTVQGSASGTAVPVSVATIPSHAVTNAGTFATQSAITAASGSVASGAVASGAFASGSIASGAMAAGSHAAGSGVDGWDLTQGAIADAAVTAGATGSVSAKLRAISRDIGTLTTLFNANGRATSANSSPTVQAPAPSTWHLVSAASTNATSVKGSATTVFSCQLGNIGSTVAYLKIYNKASSPTVGTDTPVKTLIIPKAGTAADGAGSNVSFGPGGLTLGTGFAAAIVGGIAVANTTAVAASEVIVNCDYE